MLFRKSKLKTLSLSPNKSKMKCFFFFKQTEKLEEGEQRGHRRATLYSSLSLDHPTHTDYHHIDLLGFALLSVYMYICICVVLCSIPVSYSIPPFSSMELCDVVLHGLPAQQVPRQQRVDWSRTPHDPPLLSTGRSP